MTLIFNLKKTKFKLLKDLLSKYHFLISVSEKESKSPRKTRKMTTCRTALIFMTVQDPKTYYGTRGMRGGQFRLDYLSKQNFLLNS